MGGPAPLDCFAANDAAAFDKSFL